MVEQLNEYLHHAPLLAIIAAYIGGLLTSFTPCIFPALPITIGVLGVRRSDSKLEAFGLAFIYVLGLAIVYAILGMIAALTGKFFGKISVHPLTNIIVGNMCILFALSMLDVIHFQLPSFLTQRRIAIEKKKNILGVFIMGATSGSVVAPCSAPVLGTLLTFVGATQNVVYGSILLLAFAFGLGTVLIIVGVSSSFVASLSKQGGWMLVIKKILGIFMLLVAEYFFVRAGMFWY